MSVITSLEYKPESGCCVLWWAWTSLCKQMLNGFQKMSSSSQCGNRLWDFIVLSSVWGLPASPPFLCNLAAALFNFSHTSRCILLTHHRLVFNPPNDIIIKNLCLWWSLSESLACLDICLLLRVEFWVFAMYSGSEPFLRWLLLTSYPSLWSIFHSLNSGFCNADIWNPYEVKLTGFSL